MIWGYNDENLRFAEELRRKGWNNECDELFADFGSHWRVINPFREE